MRVSVGGADQCSGGTPIYSSQFDGGASAAANAFDDSLVSRWATANTLTGYIGYHFAAPVDVAELSISTGNAGELLRTPKTFTLQWSDDGSAWTTALSPPDQTDWDYTVPRLFVVPIYVSATGVSRTVERIAGAQFTSVIASTGKAGTVERTLGATFTSQIAATGVTRNPTRVKNSATSSSIAAAGTVRAILRTVYREALAVVLEVERIYIAMQPNKIYSSRAPDTVFAETQANKTHVEKPGDTLFVEK